MLLKQVNLQHYVNWNLLFNDMFLRQTLWICSFNNLKNERVNDS